MTAVRDPRTGLRQDNQNRGTEMKNLLKLLGCGLCAFAIGCGDQAASPPAQTPDPKAMEAMMQKSMQKAAESATSTEEKAGETTEKAGETTEKAGEEAKKDGDEAKKDDTPKEDK